MQTHPASVNEHPHSLRRATSATGVLQFRNGLGESIRGGFFDSGSVNTRLDQTAFCLRCPLITPVLKQPLQARRPLRNPVQRP